MTKERLGVEGGGGGRSLVVNITFICLTKERFGGGGGRRSLVVNIAFQHVMKHNVTSVRVFVGWLLNVPVTG